MWLALGQLQSVNESAPTEIISIATDTQILTSKPDQLRSEDVSLAASIAQRFSISPVVPYLLRLTMAMQTFSVSNSSTPEVVQPNIAVRTIALQESSATVLFSALKGSTNGLVSDQITVDEQANGLKTDVSTEIQILINVTSANSTGRERVGFVLYQNDRLFPSKVYKNKLEENYSNRIVSGNVDGTVVHNVKIALNPQSFRINYEYARPLDILSYIGCGLSIAGLAVTILFQILTSLCSSMLVFNIIFISGIENSNANKRHDAISATNQMLTSDEEGPPENVWCTVVAALLHYFLLATFVWTALNSVQLYLLLIKTQLHFPRYYSTVMSLAGWVLPALFVSITLAITYEKGNYRQEEFCWLAALDADQKFSVEKPMLWAFLLPVAIILLFNFTVFVKIMVSVTWKENKTLRSTRRTSLMKKLFTTLSTAVVLGITWILGYLMLIDNKKANIAFSYVFCIFSATQGLQMFVFHVVGTPIFTKKVAKVFASFSEIQISFHSATYSLVEMVRSRNKESTLERSRKHKYFKSTDSMKIFDGSSVSCR
ncbi:hypothetical protein lerEdw1_011306 [Lerista edwardsae]|nr:hypothetical protein lerEdw1_011306 [Lerista edwardsae]